MAYVQIAHRRGGEEDHGRRSGYSDQVVHQATATDDAGRHPQRAIGEPPDNTKPRRGPLPWREAMQLADRRLFDDYSRACAGVRVLEVLRRDATDPIVFWERVIRWLPKLFEIKRKGEWLVREPQVADAPRLSSRLRSRYGARGTGAGALRLSESALARTSRPNPAERAG
jgi:hypothetical protein